MINPSAGFDMASLSASDNRGRSNPYEPLFTSSMEEGSGEEPSSLMETWEYALTPIKIMRNKTNDFILKGSFG